MSYTFYGSEGVYEMEYYKTVDKKQILELKVDQIKKIEIIKKCTLINCMKDIVYVKSCVASFW